MDNENSLAKPFKVEFSSKQRKVGSYDKNIIYVWPTDEGWNDFKYKTHGLFVVKLEDDQIISGSVLIAVQDQSENDDISYTGLGNQITSISDKNAKADFFFSLLPSIGEYRNIVRDVGVPMASKILNSLNDLVYTNEQEKDAPWLEGAQNSEVFQKSFMRNSEPFFAFYNAGDILKGLDFENLDYISNTLNLKFKLDGFLNEHELELRFGNSDLVPKRINILIGENGLGKSQSLNHFVRAALQQRQYLDELIDPTSESKRPMISRLLAIGTPGETTNTYPTDSIKNPKLHYRRLLLTRNSRSKTSRTIGKSIVQLARMDDSISNLERWDIFIEAIKSTLPIDKLRVPLAKDFEGRESVSLKKLHSGWNEERRLQIWANISDNVEPTIAGEDGEYPLSSGQLSFFKFALLACLHIENGSFVLLDEPETHLHPSMISDFITLLDNILEKTGSYALIATHSAYFVREVTREQVHVFKKFNNEEIQILNPRLKTFGANIGDISHFVFDEDYGNSLSQKVIRKANIKNLSYDDIKKKYGSILPTEMLQSIKVKLVSQ
ncbi:AAA family ATPase [Vibrio sp. M260112]|uniref:AAA family ATPase n=1 Tax=Vibrio sp. M260112 TaxID=3020895 RepID=UPI002F411011